jgi:hypothetical protein
MLKAQQTLWVASACPTYGLRHTKHRYEHYTVQLMYKGVIHAYSLIQADVSRTNKRTFTHTPLPLRVQNCRC